jgi:hypothetical protein
MHGMEKDEHEAICPHCGADSQWYFVDPEKRQIEILCPNCRKYEMSREQFDRTAAECVEPNDPGAA